MTAVRQAIAAKRQRPEAVLSHLPADGDAIVGLGNGEPKTVIDAIEAGAAQLDNLRLHQMLPLRDRPYIEGEVDGMRHVSWFLSRHDKDAFQRGDCDLVPNNFSEVPILLRQTVRDPIALAAVSPPDEHGYFSLGCHAEYVAPMVGEMPFFIEVNAQMPRTFGENQIHISQILGWCEADYPLVEVPPREPQEADRRIAELVAERIPNGATIQAGIGAVPDQVLALLAEHRDLGVHTELLSDGLRRPGREGGDHRHPQAHPPQQDRSPPPRSAPSALVRLRRRQPGGRVLAGGRNQQPAARSAEEPHFTSINATIEVDFLGQCASESLGSAYWSSSGGQPDFARGAVLSENGQAFIVLHSTTSDGKTSRIVPRLHPGAAVTTFKNVVDRIVTEYGVAELRGSTIAERTQPPDRHRPPQVQGRAIAGGSRLRLPQPALSHNYDPPPSSQPPSPGARSSLVLRRSARHTTLCSSDRQCDSARHSPRTLGWALVDQAASQRRVDRVRLPGSGLIRRTRSCPVQPVRHERARALHRPLARSQANRTGVALLLPCEQCTTRCLPATQAHHHFVGVAPAPVLAGLGRADDRVAGRPRGGRWRACRSSCRSSRCGRRSGTSAGAPSSSPAPGTPRSPATSPGEVEVLNRVEVGALSHCPSRSRPARRRASSGPRPGAGVSRRYRSASRAPMQPVPAAVTAWR